MPLYEDRRNALNSIRVEDEIRDGILVGPEKSINGILKAIRETSEKKKQPLSVAFEGWYGTDWDSIMELVGQYGRSQKLSLVTENISRSFKTQKRIDEYKKRFVTDDPGFGRVNEEGVLGNLLDPDKIAQLKDRLHGSREPNSVYLIYGCGSAAADLSVSYDLLFYFDKTRQPLLWQMWDGNLIPFGMTSPKKGYHWKEYYYCDYYLLHRQKIFSFERMDFYLEAANLEDLKLIPRRAYDSIMSTLVRYPIKEVQIYQPGPWGAYRYRDLWEVPGLKCNIGLEKPINMPTMNLMQYSEKFVGPYLHREYPELFPLDVWLDDGYFPKPTPAERTSMPIHNHPGTGYVKSHFGEPLGRYETYYIAEAYKDANTWLGYRDEADLEEWERKCRESERDLKEIEDWKDYIARWDSNVGDLYLIPGGTTHGHGGNQMVLEMDTCPSIAGTEYSFFLYDFVRNSWDDKTKTMTGRPVKLHTAHGFDNEKWRRESWVADRLLAKARVIEWNKEFSMDRYDTYPTMPFHIERFHFKNRALNHTHGRFMHILTPTVGERVKIRSVENPVYEAEIEWLQSVIVPAGFGEYELVNVGGGNCTVVQLRWKKG
jgi:hypothetical protein